MIQSAGPRGKEAMLAIDPKNLDAKSKEYIAKIRPAIEKASLDSVRPMFVDFPGDATLSDQDVTARLATMEKNFAKDDHANATTILNSGLSADFLISQLIKIRRVTLHRLSDEALSDVEISDALINGLRYWEK
jgi:hypothetical protein